MQIVVQEWERVLVYRDGRFAEAIGPGRHRRRRWHRRFVRVSIRPRLLAVPGQEVLTADGLAVKVSLTVAVSTADPRRWHETVDVPDGFVYSALQVGLREVVAAGTFEELLAGRGTLADQVRERVGAAAEAVGVAIDSLALRDVMVPAEIRRAAADVVTARAQGQAVLSGPGRRSRPPGRWPTPRGSSPNSPRCCSYGRCRRWRPAARPSSSRRSDTPPRPASAGRGGP